MIVKNDSSKTRYYSTKSNDFVSLIEIPLKISDLNTSSLATHIENCKFLSLNPTNYMPVIDGIYPIPPNSSWVYFDKKFSQIKQKFVNTFIEYEPQDFKRITSRYLKVWGKDISVELSGGLDTSIIIGLLRAVGINPYLIGAESDRFEFRTERYIQKKLTLDENRTSLFSDVDGLPFANLQNTPVHFLPNKSSLFFHTNTPTLNAAKKFNVKVILNGIGMDSLLIDAVGGPSKKYYFDMSNIDDSWANDYVFEPHGINYLNVATIPFVKQMLISLRKNQSEDLQKLWARRFFKDFIPIELSMFAYKASFGAVNFEGLTKSKEEIIQITNSVYKLTSLAVYEEGEMRNLIDKVLSFDSSSEFLFFALLSYAVWAHKLIEGGLIKD
jgi:hypothetical protein